MMKTLIHTLVTAMALLLLVSGCGQKGDLYLPETESTDAGEEKKEDSD